MEVKDYRKILVEVDETLNHLSNEDYAKIPKDIILFIKNNKDKEFTWTFDENRCFREQKLSRDAISILSYINMEYLLNAEQKDFMKKIIQKNAQKFENKELYSLNDIFKKRKKN